MDANDRKGFTIIELLLVLAVIGILSTLMLAVISSSRGKARDNRVRSDIRQIRVLTETVYNAQGGTYVDWTQHASIASELAALTADVDAQTKVSDSTTMRESQEKEFCISAPLEAADGHFCTDVTGTIRRSGTPCPDLAIDEDPLRCPSL